MKRYYHAEHDNGALGFSLLEALLSLGMLSLVMVSFLGSLGEFRDVVMVEGDVCEASEDLRFAVGNLVRQIRMAGAGGLPLVAPGADGALRPLAIDVSDNVSPDQFLESSAGGPRWSFEAGRLPIEGTDILRIRGVLATPRYGISKADFVGQGRCRIASVSPWTGLDQDLDHPRRGEGRPFLFALQAPLTFSLGNDCSREIEQWRVVEIVEEPVFEDCGGYRSLNLAFDDGSLNAFTALNFGNASRVKPGEVFSGGFLDDLVFLVSENTFGGTSLYRLRPFRGGGGRVLAEEMVPNVHDFQVALGCDLDDDGRVADDEWFLSRQRPDGPTGEQMAHLRHIRLSIVTRTLRPDRRWQGGLKRVENGSRSPSGSRGFRYQMMSIRVSPRIVQPIRRDPIGGF
jgi:hypothetical protein